MRGGGLSDREDQELRPESARRAPVAPLQQALSHAQRLLDRDPALAARQAMLVLDRKPGEPSALHTLGRAEAALGRHAAARRSLEAAAAGDPNLAGVWRDLGDACARLNEAGAADVAYRRHVEAAVCDPDLMHAAEALAENRLDLAETRLKARLRSAPTDVAALRMLGELAARLGRLGDAETLLAHTLEIAPGFIAARHNYAVTLYRQNRGEAALSEVRRLRAARPDEPAFRILEAAVLALVGEYEAAVAIYHALLSEREDQPKLWLSLGHALKTLGRTAEAVGAYRRCVALAPSLGEAWWSLANLKTERFTAEERGALARLAKAPQAGEDDRLHLLYAHGKALQDDGCADAAFDAYAAGAAIQKRRIGYRATETSAQVERARAVFTADLLATHAGRGCPAADPIFIVGLPRSGSTLIEQILSTHPQVEGTMELAELSATARRAGALVEGATYPDALAGLDGAALRSLGESYLDGVRIHRRAGRPLFIDKMPNNWLHTGLIRLILPYAKIIDARRHPMGACFSAFKQHFARGQGFSYDLDDLGRYYRDYVGLMDHFDQAMPGAVHRAIYEDMVEDTEGEVRRLLAYCGLPFDPACLRFHETARAVRTASSEQVRRPIYRQGLDQWRAFERHLGPLKSALGPVLETWRERPPP